VYKGFDIGTAKPTTEEQKGVPHHLLDIVSADEPFDAARFVKVADKAIADITGRGKKALVVGGTGLYIRVLLHGLQEGPPPNSDLRKNLLARAEEQGRAALHRQLAEVDPEAAARLHPNDIVRVVRALEVTMTSGVTMTSWQRRHGFQENRCKFLMLAVSRPREVLNRIIEDRTDRMMHQGFLEEVKGLLASGVSPLSKPMQALGYKRLTEHLQGKCSLDEAVAQIKIDTRRFAKRQMTWFKKEPDLEWTAPDLDLIEARCIQFRRSFLPEEFRP
jgi:tRNA dimethylallyltransferase